MDPFMDPFMGDFLSNHVWSPESKRSSGLISMQTRPVPAMPGEKQPGPGQVDVVNTTLHR